MPSRWGPCQQTYPPLNGKGVKWYLAPSAIPRRGCGCRLSEGDAGATGEAGTHHPPTARGVSPLEGGVFIPPCATDRGHQVGDSTRRSMEGNGAVPHQRRVHRLGGTGVLAGSGRPSAIETSPGGGTLGPRHQRRDGQGGSSGGLPVRVVHMVHGTNA